MVIKGKTIIAIILSIAMFFLILTLGFFLASHEYGRPVIGLIHIDNVITESSSGVFWETSRSFLDQLRHAEQDKGVQAIVLRVNSPGGSSGMSQELYRNILRISKNKPVVVSMGDIAASGGYYLASAANYIFANGSTITGSIGVIMEFPNYQELYNKIGIEFERIKSGELKDAGNVSRSLEPAEKELFHSVVLNAWDQFVVDVAKARNLSREDVEEIADGRILTGQQALEHKLIDEIGGLEEAIKKAVSLAGIEEEPFIKTYQDRSNWFSRILSTVEPVINLLTQLNQPSVRLKYQI